MKKEDEKCLLSHGIICEPGNRVISMFYIILIKRCGFFNEFIVNIKRSVHVAFLRLVWGNLICYKSNL